MRDEKIVLLRLPTNLASDVKNLIGTLLLSEVLHAAFERAKLPEKERRFFGIYCDEFQEFWVLRTSPEMVHSRKR
jgi:hypothetical protein